MLRKSNFHGVELSNIPHVNLRRQFQRYHALFDDPQFLSGWRSWRGGDSIETPFFSWYGFPHEMYTLVIQQSVLGLESYVPGAAYFQAGMSGKLTPELAKLIRDPFAIPGRASTARRYYVMVPALLSENLSLDKARPELWPVVSMLYREIRNPLFHGRQILSDNPEPIRPVLQLIADVYTWVDSWHNPADVWRTAGGPTSSA